MTAINDLPTARPALIAAHATDLFRTASGVTHEVVNGTLKCTPTKPLPKRGTLAEAKGGPAWITDHEDGNKYRTGLRYPTCHRCNGVNWH